MTPPDKCPRCGSAESASEYSKAYCCGTLVSTSGKFYHTTTCHYFSQFRKPLDIERDQLAARVSDAERERDQSLAVLGAYKMDKDELKARVKELEVELERAKEDRNQAGVIARRQMLPRMEELSARVKELEAYTERLESTGDNLAIWAPREPWRKLWADAKEAKP